MADKMEAGLQESATINNARNAAIPTHIRAVKWFLLTAAFVVALTTYRSSSDRDTVQLGYTIWTPSSEVCGQGSFATKTSNPDGVWKTVPVGDTNGLNWTKCYDDKYCARMAVSLDYSSPDDPRRATIALIKVPAKVPADSAAYRGPVLFNPGGPGGSGVVFVRGLGEALQHVLGDDYDIVGFDPRGVGFTDPIVDVFPDEAEGAAWLLKNSADPLFNMTADAMSRIYARSTIFNGLAAERTSHASPYVSTASVARDMLGIMNAHGYDKIQYWGFSYGTVLGSTFASIFPNNVGRLVIDGVVDVQNYYDTLWDDNLVDTHKVLEAFFAECVTAGPELCAFHESTSEKVEARLNALFDRLKRRPLAVPLGLDPTDSSTYGLVDYALLRTIVFVFTYSPYEYAALLAYGLSEAEKGNGRVLWDAWQAKNENFQCQCAKSPTPAALTRGDALLAILCADGAEVHDSIDELEAFQARMLQTSPFAELWIFRARCVNWKMRPKDRFTGRIEGNTSFPLLIVGNTADPVTPVRHAHTVSKGFNGSVVLTQDSAGHCSLAASSLCTVMAIRAYFREGTLPKSGTICDASSKMFPAAGLDSLESELVGEERQVMEAWSSLRDAYIVPHFGLMPIVRMS